MTSLARIRPLSAPRRLRGRPGALLVPATAGASVHAHAAAKKKKAKSPVVTSVRPMNVEIGQTLDDPRASTSSAAATRTPSCSSATAARPCSSRPKIGTTKLLRVTVPAKLAKEFAKVGSSVVPTRFRIRVLSKKFGKTVHDAHAVAADRPAVGGHAAGLVESTRRRRLRQRRRRTTSDADDDNDGLPDTVEASLNLNPCSADTDGDGNPDRCEFDCDRNGVSTATRPTTTRTCSRTASRRRSAPIPATPTPTATASTDGYEYQSACDLNDDEYQQPNSLHAATRASAPTRTRCSRDAEHRLRRRLR